MLAVIQDDAEALALFREAMVDGPGQPRLSETKSISDNITNTSEMGVSRKTVNDWNCGKCHSFKPRAYAAEKFGT
jgi:hypothetical protein